MRSTHEETAYAYRDAFAGLLSGMRLLHHLPEFVGNICMSALASHGNSNAFASTVSILA